MSLKRFGVSLEDNLLESLDQYAPSLYASKNSD